MGCFVMGCLVMGHLVIGYFVMGCLVMGRFVRELKFVTSCFATMQQRQSKQQSNNLRRQGNFATLCNKQLSHGKKCFYHSPHTTHHSQPNTHLPTPHELAIGWWILMSTHHSQSHPSLCPPDA